MRKCANTTSTGQPRIRRKFIRTPVYSARVRVLLYRIGRCIGPSDLACRLPSLIAAFSSSRRSWHQTLCALYRPFQVDGVISRTRQVGSTPPATRCFSMKAIICGTGNRALPRCTIREAGSRSIRASPRSRCRPRCRWVIGFAEPTRVTSSMMYSLVWNVEPVRYRTLTLLLLNDPWKASGVVTGENLTIN